MFQVFPDFVRGVYDFGDPDGSLFIRYAANAVMYLVPFIEASIGIFLLYPSTRKLGSALALIMFCVILLCVRPPQTNINATKGIWMWNIWLYIMEFRLFMYGRNLRAPFFLFAPSRLCKVSIVLFVLAPFLAIWFPSAYIFGFKMYSGNNTRGEVVFEQAETFAHVPSPLKEVLVAQRSITLGNWMQVVEDSYVRGHSPFVMKASAAGLCRYLDHPEQAKLNIKYPGWFYTREREVETVPLCTVPQR